MEHIFLLLWFFGNVRERLQVSVELPAWTQIPSTYTYTGPPNAIAGSVIVGGYRPELIAIRVVNAATANVAH